MTLKITTIGYKLQFVCLIGGGLIGGRVFNPRQQQALDMLLIVCLVLNKLTLY